MVAFFGIEMVLSVVLVTNEVLKTGNLVKNHGVLQRVMANLMSPTCLKGMPKNPTRGEIREKINPR